MENKIAHAADEVLIRTGRPLSASEMIGSLRELAALRVTREDLDAALSPASFPRDAEGRFGLVEFPPAFDFGYLDPALAVGLRPIGASR